MVTVVSCERCDDVIERDPPAERDLGNSGNGYTGGDIGWHTNLGNVYGRLAPTLVAIDNTTYASGQRDKRSETKPDIVLCRNCWIWLMVEIKRLSPPSPPPPLPGSPDSPVQVG